MEQNTLWVNKEPTLGHKIGQQKSSVVILLAVVLVAYALSICVAFFWSRSVFAIVEPLFFLSVGVLHVNRLENDFQSLTVAQKWVCSLVIALTIFLLFWIASFWNIRFPVISMLAGAVAFLLPFVLSELVKIYLQLTFGNASFWQVNSEASLTYPDVYLKGIPFRFRLEDAESETVFFQTEFRTLPDMKLGEVFYDLMQKQAKKGIGMATLSDDEQQPYYWLFYTNGMLGSNRLLDPSLSLEENSLKKDSFIYAQRFPPGTAIASPKQKALKELI